VELRLEAGDSAGGGIELSSNLVIRDVEVLSLAVPLAEPLRWATGELSHRRATLVRVTSESGLHGWGEAASHGGVPGLDAVIAEGLAPLIIGADAAAPEQRWTELYAFARRHGRGGLQMAAIAGLDIALWDLRARAAGRPLRELLGGRDEASVPVYATGFYFREGMEPSDEAAAHLASGFRAMKMKVGGRAVPEDLAAVAAVRERIGPDPALMVDANRAYDLAAARRMAAGVAALDVAWLEEPLDPGRTDDYRELRRAVPLPLAAGEGETELGEFASLTSSGAVDVLQPSLCVAGGITPLRRIAAAAERAGVTVVPHCWASAIGLAATAHALTTLPAPTGDVPVALELDTTPNPLRSELAGRLAVHDGRLELPSGPGLGVEPIQAVIDEYLERSVSARPAAGARS
jgi:D-galactarolactone cycloisomerase